MQTTSKPLKDFLTNHLKSCLTPGTSAPGSGIKVAAKPLPGEIIILFQTDSSNGKRCLNVGSEKICDYLYFYNKNADKEIACFLELKGTDLKSAAEQVEKTHEHLENLISKKVANDIPFLARVCICLRSHASSTSQKIRDKLIKIYGNKNIEIRHGITRHDIGPLLRR